MEKAIVTLIKLPSLMPIKSLSFHASVPPLGLAYLAAVLREKAYDVQVLDAVGDSVKSYRKYDKNQKLMMHGLRIKEIVENLNPNTKYVGITSMFLHEYEMLVDLSELIKNTYPHMIVIAGGENVTSLCEQIYKDTSAIDYCVLGEGEAKIIDLLYALENNLDVNDVDGLCYSNSGVTTKTHSGKRLQTLEQIPWPAWDLIKLENYFGENLNSGVNRGRSIPMLTSRGCPYQCKFCSAPEMWTTKYVTRSPKDVVDEVEHYIKNYKIANIDFHDLTSFLTQKWIKEFCELIEARNLKFTWQIPQGSRSEVITEETADLLYRSGCRNYTFAPESGSERLIKLMKKKLTVDKVIDAIKIAKKHKMLVDANIIVGTPDEEPADVWKTYKMIIKLAFSGIDGIGVMPFGPYPGSEYYNDLVASGKVKFNREYIYSSLLRASTSIESYNKNFSAWQILTIQYVFLFTFYGLLYLTRPWQFIISIRNAITRKEERMMDQFLGTKVRQLISSKNLKAD